jgi:hypothetical protein
MRRLVITPWDGKNANLLDRCVESVKESGIEHRVVQCGPEWELTMYSMRNDADAIAWVDADDIVYPGAIVLAFDMLEQHDVGLAYTNECRIDLNDKQTYSFTTIPRTTWDLASHPGSVHHLTVTRKDTITDRVLEVHKRTRTPLDWAMRVDAAAHRGMVHVPILGYGWREHPTQITANPKCQLEMRESIPQARNSFREWITGIKQT